MISLAWLILWIPFFTAFLIFFFLLDRPRVAGAAATAGMFSTFVLSLILLLMWRADAAAAHASPLLQSSVVWVSLGKTAIEFGILLNGLSLLMLLIVTGVGAFIFLYSTAYMEKDENAGRYFAALSFFAFSMLGIVLANNLIQLFIFWELVGLSSYLLIGFWFEKTEAATAGKKAFLTTRVGDVGMMLGILLLFSFAGTFNFMELQSGVGAVHASPLQNIPSRIMAAIAILLFLGVVGKSAQMPLHVWLPDAMEGPTPVSALIHAATMVAAGVFLLARLFFLFIFSPEILDLIAWIGGVTAFFTATIAFVQTDIKKTLAYSTLSQLGLMVMAVGLRSSEAGMFHLATHAFFKALLFLGAGSLIHALHTQNIWKMARVSRDTAGGLFKKMPITSWSFLFGTLALLGIFPTSGYFSKDEILIVAADGPVLLYGMALATVFFTAFYMGRLLTVVFGSEKKHVPAAQPHEPHPHPIRESGPRMAIPLIVLAIFSVIGGLLPIRELLPDRTFFEESYSITRLAHFLAMGGFLLAYLIYRRRLEGASEAWPILRPVKFLLDRKYFFDDLYDLLIRHVQENFARLSDGFERVVIVKLGVNGAARMLRGVGDLLRKLQTGVVQFYATFFAAGVTVLIYLWILGGLS